MSFMSFMTQDLPAASEEATNCQQRMVQSPAFRTRGTAAAPAVRPDCCSQYSSHRNAAALDFSHFSSREAASRAQEALSVSAYSRDYFFFRALSSAPRDYFFFRAGAPMAGLATAVAGTSAAEVEGHVGGGGEDRQWAEGKTASLL